MVNMNVVAVEVSKCEGKKIQQPIGQIKETCKCQLIVLARDYKPEEILKLVNRYMPKKKKKK